MNIQTNQEIKGFTVINAIPVRINHKETNRNHTRQHIFVRCNKCKKEYYVSKTNLTSKKSCFSCFECSMECIAQVRRGSKHTAWKGFGHIPKTYFSQVIKGGRRQKYRV